MTAPEPDRPHYSTGAPVPDFIDSSTRQASRGANPTTGAKTSEPAEPAPTLTSAAPTGGALAGGTVVTVTGDNLGGSTAATVGGVAATVFSVLSETQVRFTTPAGTAGAKAIAVANPAGASTGTVNFTYA